MQDGGLSVILGEMDVARVNPYRSGQGELTMHFACCTPHRSAAVIQLRGGGGLEISLLPGGRRPLSSDGIGRWGMGMTFGHPPSKDKKRDRLRAQSRSQSESWLRIPPVQRNWQHFTSIPLPRRADDAALANKPCLLKGRKNAGTHTSTVIVTESVRGRLGIPCNA